MAIKDINNNTDNEIKFANWNSGYEDMFKQIVEIRDIGNKLLFDVDNKGLLLNTYYSRISGLFITHGHYIVKDHDRIKSKLFNMEQVLFSNKYLTSVKNGTFNTDKNKKMMQDLKEFFQIICESFSKNGLTMKVIIKRKKASDNSKLTSVERKEIEALEEVGIM